jgi:hypothetical protein
LKSLVASESVGTQFSGRAHLFFSFSTYVYQYLSRQYLYDKEDIITDF